MKALVISFCVLAATLVGCRGDGLDDVKSDDPVVTALEQPAGWPAPHYDFAQNKITADGFRLGRKLFYEPMLSRDNSISCGSCHQQFAAFAHDEHKLSHGIDGLFGTRNAPGLYNLAWHPNFMWDGGVNHIELQPFAPMTNPVEMDETLPNVLEKLNASASYRDLFEKAFGSEEINSQRLFYAMVQFMGSMVSATSKYDWVMRGELPGGFSEAEFRGLRLFRQQCASCHTEPLFTDFSFRNNGLEPSPLLMDSGRAHITGLPEDRYKFKVPSLRNVGVTQPYMHDGRFPTLRQAIAHYASGIAPIENLDPQLAEGGIPLSDAQITDIEAFLHTLTDYEFMQMDAFAEPLN
jgi:cytochrome c peroxidase